MNDMKNSELLEKIIEYAKSYGGKGTSTLTAERYLISVIDVVSGTTSIEINDEDKASLLTVLINSFPEDLGFKKIKKSLAAHIEEKKDSSYMDGLYIQQRMFKAKDAAKKNGMEQLSPDVLLKCILDDPDDYIKSQIACGGKGDVEDIEKIIAGTDALLSELGKKFDEIFDEKNEEEPVKETTEIKQDSNISPKQTVAKLTEKAKNIHDKLVESVYGQDNAVSVFTTGYFRAELLSLTDKKRTRPKATFLFAGPPGVGKTFLAEKAAEALELPYQRFDMSEYSDKEANI